MSFKSIHFPPFGKSESIRCSFRVCVKTGGGSFSLLLLLLLASCEQPLPEDGTEASPDGTLQLTIIPTGFEQLTTTGTFSLKGPTRTTTDITPFTTRLSCGIYHNGQNVKVLHQQSTDTRFGSFSLSLPPASYQLVLIAHNGQSACTISSPEKITFNGKTTDTYSWCQPLSLTTDTTLHLALPRTVAQIQYTPTNLPEGTTQLKFYYTGGSSTLDALTGRGCVNSRQTEYRDIPTTDTPPTYTLYTFPHQETGTLHLKCYALNAQGDTLTMSDHPSIPIRRNTITPIP